jgi:hypothetical protein
VSAGLSVVDDIAFLNVASVNGVAGCGGVSGAWVAGAEVGGVCRHHVYTHTRKHHKGIENNGLFPEEYLV